MGHEINLLLYYKNLIIIIIVPILLLPLPLVTQTKPGLCGYFLLLMGTYWCTECLPLGVTSLMPVFLAPMFGFITTSEVCPLYFDKINMMLTGGLIVALAIERCNLHKRIALKILLLIGVSPKWLLLGFMLPTWFLSMWISNTATSAMMLPIVLEVIHQVDAGNKADINFDTMDDQEMEPRRLPAVNLVTEVYNDMEPEPDYESDAVVIKSQTNLVTDEPSQRTEGASEAVESKSTTMDASNAPPLAKALLICIAFSANSGGVGTLIGTTVNLICKTHADDIWQENIGTDSPINFATWMGFGIPISLINLFIIWVWLGIYFIGPKEFFGCGAKRDEKRENTIKQIILKEYLDCGPIRFAEVQVGVIFIFLVLLWFFRKPDFIPGWAILFEEGYVGDAVPAILMAVLVFALYSYYPTRVVKGEQPHHLMDWQMITDKFPWSVILLLGGGLALAESTETSGLSDWIGNELTAFDVLPGPAIIFILTYIVTLLTQFTSNTASASLMMPIVANMAMQLDRNPLYLMLPVTIGTQLAFMLPVATPPNAVVFTSGLLTVMDLVKAGTILNIVLTAVATGATLAWGAAIFDINTLPWDYENATALAHYIKFQDMKL